MRNNVFRDHKFLRDKPHARRGVSHQNVLVIGENEGKIVHFFANTSENTNMLVENNSNKAHFDAIYGGGPPSNDDYARSTYSGYRESVRSDKIPATPMVLEDSSATLQGMEEGQGVTKKGAIPGEKRKKECPRCCWWIFGIVMVLLLAAGLTTFFLWPRQPGKLIDATFFTFFPRPDSVRRHKNRQKMECVGF